MKKKIIILLLFALHLILTACTSKQFEITFDSNGGTELESVIANKGDTIELETPIREGHEFIGWYTSKEFNREFTENTKVEENLTLYAFWLINQYTITYETNGGNNFNPITKNYGEEISLATPYRQGFTFAGWFADSNFDKEFTSSTMPAENITIYAKWLVNSVSVFIDKSDGSEVELQIVEYGDIVKALEDPVRDGYKFLGWYSDLNFNNLYDFNKKVTGTTFLYANWELIDYNITYNIDQGIWNDFNESSELVNEFLVDFYNYINPVENIDVFIHGEEDDNNFNGTWLTKHFDALYIEKQRNADLQPYFINQVKYNQKWLTFFDMIDNFVKKDYENNSFWTDKEIAKLYLYSYITRDEEVLTLSQLNLLPTFEPIYTSYNVESRITLQEPKRLNHVFKGFYTNPDFKGEAIYSIEPGLFGDLNLYAKWDEVVYKEYQITFDSRGGNKIDSSFYDKYDIVEKLPTPTKEDGEFAYWIYNNKILETPFVYDFAEDISLEAVWLVPYYSNEEIKVNNRDGNPVLIPDKFGERDGHFKGVWVSNLTGDISSYQSKSQMQKQLIELLDNLVEWEINAVVYHIRIYNDALYDIDLSPRSNYVSQVNFAQWDYLEWFIAECHKRGIEFHAWMNPYRIASSGNGVKDDYVNRYSDYPQNPANDPDNILITNGGGAILNPGEPEVRDFLVDVCLEVMEKYNVDAIHFDDYFYAAMNQNEDSATYLKYNPERLGLEDWRREQVNMFIRDLSIAMNEFNITNGRSVELGISPGGIWQDGDGKVTYDENGTAITNGSNTAMGWEHYKYYLYSDTKKWIDEEWINYIIPQIYWGFTLPSAGYAETLDWWAAVVKHKNVKLYSGLGVHVESTSNAPYSWKTNPYEFSDQILYNSKSKEVNGYCAYNYSYFKNMYNK